MHQFFVLHGCEQFRGVRKIRLQPVGLVHVNPGVVLFEGDRQSQNLLLAQFGKCFAIPSGRPVVFNRNVPGKTLLLPRLVEMISLQQPCMSALFRTPYGSGSRREQRELRGSLRGSGTKSELALIEFIHESHNVLSTRCSDKMDYPIASLGRTESSYATPAQSDQSCSRGGRLLRHHRLPQQRTPASHCIEGCIVADDIMTIQRVLP